MIIRGGNEGGLDGIDVWGFDIWVHDIEVMNRDEYVTVTSPANHILIENIYCNWSGGCAMGSLGAGTDISKIEYNNVYTVDSNQMFMFKSNGGSGTVTGVSLNNFIGHNSDCVYYNSISFNDWKDDCANGVNRPPLYVNYPAKVLCTNIAIYDFAMWTLAGSKECYECVNAWGSDYCLEAGSAHTSYAAVTSTVAAAPSGYSPAKMPSDLASGLGITKSIAIPTVPTSFFPGATPATKRAYS